MKEHDADTIIDYLNGVLDSATSLQVEERIKIDADFAMEVDMFKGFRKILHDDDFLHNLFVQRLKKKHEQKQKEAVPLQLPILIAHLAIIDQNCKAGKCSYLLN